MFNKIALNFIEHGPEFGLVINFFEGYLVMIEFT